MTQYDYKVVPAPKRMKKLKGVKDTTDLLAHTLTEAINEVARDGWEYVRAETLTAEEPGGLLRRAHETTQTVLVFRRPRPDTFGPRLTAVEAEPAAARLETRAVRETPARASDAPRPATGPALRPALGRVEPQVAEEAGTPLRPAPRLGPAEKI